MSLNWFIMSEQAESVDSTLTCEQHLKKAKSKKRPPMRTAMEVVKRIIWDESVPEDSIVIGYKDRFLGIVEKPFSAFSWDPLDSLDYYTFGIPEHRIEYFKYKNALLWEKRTLLDNVFGSQGSGCTIHDVMRKYDEAEANVNHATCNPTASTTVGDDDDDGVTVISDARNEVPETSSPVGTDPEEADDVDDAYWQNKLRPNFFICHRIDSPELIQEVERLQSHIRNTEPAYETCCIHPNALHLTLKTLRLDNASHVSECVHALNLAKEELQQLLPTRCLKIHGLNTFHGRVVYAAVEHSDELSNFVDHLDLVLRSSGLRPTDGRDFVPHVTLIKLRRPAARKLGVNRIPPSLYEDFSDCSFGSQLFNTIYLCSMEKTRDADGFYVSPAHVTFMRQVL